MRQTGSGPGCCGSAASVGPTRYCISHLVIHTDIRTPTNTQGLIRLLCTAAHNGAIWCSHMLACHRVLCTMESKDGAVLDTSKVGPLVPAAICMVNSRPKTSLDARYPIGYAWWNRQPCELQNISDQGPRKTSPSSQTVTSVIRQADEHKRKHKQEWLDIEQLEQRPAVGASARLPACQLIIEETVLRGLT